VFSFTHKGMWDGSAEGMHLFRIGSVSGYSDSGNDHPDSTKLREID
jgi:hypothetical protein